MLGVSHEKAGGREENPCGNNAGAGTDEEEEKRTVKQLEVGGLVPEAKKTTYKRYSLCLECWGFDEA